MFLQFTKWAELLCCRPESMKRPLRSWKPTSGILCVANQIKDFGCPSDLISLRQYPCRSRAPFVSSRLNGERKLRGRQMAILPTLYLYSQNFYRLRNDDVRFRNGPACFKYGSVANIALLVVIWVYIFYRNCGIHYWGKNAECYRNNIHALCLTENVAPPPPRLSYSQQNVFHYIHFWLN